MILFLGLLLLSVILFASAISMIPQLIVGVSQVVYYTIAALLTCPLAYIVGGILLLWGIIF